jgi:hypothetical protein
MKVSVCVLGFQRNRSRTNSEADTLSSARPLALLERKIIGFA